MTTSAGPASPPQAAEIIARSHAVLEAYDRDEIIEDALDWAMDRARLVRFVAKKR